MTNVVYFLSAAARDPNALLTTVLLPFLIIFVILWGLLNLIKLFGPEGRKINLVLAFAITIFAAFTDAWGVVATQLAVFSGVFVYVMFFAVFILGTIFWAIGRTRGIYREHIYSEADYNDIKELDKQLAKVVKKLQEAQYKGDAAKMKVYGDTYKKLQERKEQLHIQKDLRSGRY